MSLKSICTQLDSKYTCVLKASLAADEIYDGSKELGFSSQQHCDQSLSVGSIELSGTAPWRWAQISLPCFTLHKFRLEPPWGAQLSPENILRLWNLRHAKYSLIRLHNLNAFMHYPSVKSVEFNCKPLMIIQPAGLELKNNMQAADNSTPCRFPQGKLLP